MYGADTSGFIHTVHRLWHTRGHGWNHFPYVFRDGYHFRNALPAGNNLPSVFVAGNIFLEVLRAGIHLPNVLVRKIILLMYWVVEIISRVYFRFRRNSGLSKTIQN
jgi:hypothetical protein